MGSFRANFSEKMFDFRLLLLLTVTVLVNLHVQARETDADPFIEDNLDTFTDRDLDAFFERLEPDVDSVSSGEIGDRVRYGAMTPMRRKMSRKHTTGRILAEALYRLRDYVESIGKDSFKKMRKMNMHGSLTKDHNTNMLRLISYHQEIHES